MNYQDVMKDSRFYLPMNLNLGYLLNNDTDIIMLMHIISCDGIGVKLSVRKLVKFMNRADKTVQKSLKRLRQLKLIDGFEPQYETLKYVFDGVNNAHTIEDRIKWCQEYQKSVVRCTTESVVESTTVDTGVVESTTPSVVRCTTESVVESTTHIKKIYKEDIEKEDILKRDILEEKPSIDWDVELDMVMKQVQNAQSCNEVEVMGKRFVTMKERYPIPKGKFKDKLNKLYDLINEKGVYFEWKKVTN